MAAFQAEGIAGGTLAVGGQGEDAEWEGEAEQWLDDPWYSDVVKYMRFGGRIHEDRLLAASHVKVSKARAARYRLVEASEGNPTRLPVLRLVDRCLRGPR